MWQVQDHMILARMKKKMVDTKPATVAGAGSATGKEEPGLPILSLDIRISDYQHYQNISLNIRLSEYKPEYYQLYQNISLNMR